MSKCKSIFKNADMAILTINILIDSIYELNKNLDSSKLNKELSLKLKTNTKKEIKIKL